ncbi:MAG: chemotaxis protein CheR, partial [Proteobacteria bacterium]|nr:chemotaxis protein CheR [Pseudomonadota bacterium]
MTSNNVVVQFFAKYIEGQLGIVYNEANSFQLESRLTDLVAFYSLGSMNELMEKAMKGFTLDMKQMVLDVATNNETSFFRDKDLFQELAQSVLQSPRFNGSDGKPLRIWCAASSTGQEPYTIAMILDQQKSLFPTRRFSLLGTDVSDRALKRCREGIYSQLEAQRGLPAPLLIKYFTPRQNAKSLLTEYEV